MRPLRGRISEGAGAVDRIIGAATRLMARDGTLAPNMRELLAEAGVGTRAFYRHFPTKDALIATIVEDIYREMRETLAARVAGAKTATERLEAWIAGVLDYAVNAETAVRGRALVLHQAELSRDHPEIFAAAGQALAAQVSAILREGASAGAIAARDPEQDARLIAQLVVAAMQRHVIARSAPSPAEVAGLTQFVLRALR